jgi:hypothetical protein
MVNQEDGLRTQYANIGNSSVNPKLTGRIPPQNLVVNTKETLTDFNQHQKNQRDLEETTKLELTTLVNRSTS